MILDSPGTILRDSLVAAVVVSMVLAMVTQLVVESDKVYRTQRESFEAWRLVGLVMVNHALGKASESDAALATLINKYEQGWAYNIAYVLAFRGEADPAFAWLDKAVQYNDPGLSEIPNHAFFANIHEDPRWLPFLESIGKSPEQLAAIKFEVTLPE